MRSFSFIYVFSNPFRITEVKFNHNLKQYFDFCGRQQISKNLFERQQFDKVLAGNLESNIVVYLEDLVVNKKIITNNIQIFQTSDVINIDVIHKYGNTG